MLNYKKPRFIVNVVLCLLVLGVSVALGTNKKTPATAVNLNTTNQIDEINADLGELVIYKQKLNSNITSSSHESSMSFTVRVKATHMSGLNQCMHNVMNARYFIM